METKNLDELYDITLELSEKAYFPESSIEKNYTFLKDSDNFPVLLYNLILKLKNERGIREECYRTNQII